MKYTREQVIKSLELHNYKYGALCRNCSYKNHVNCTTDLLQDAITLLKSTDEAAQWIPRGIYAKCSNCDGGVDVYVSKHYQFCPFCGRRMADEPYDIVASGDRTASADGTNISGYRVDKDDNK